MVRSILNRIYLPKTKCCSSNAFIAHLYLTSEPLDFLVDYKYEISSVNEYKAGDVFYMKHAPIPKNIDRWLVLLMIP